MIGASTWSWISADGDIIGGARRRVEQRVGRQRAAYIDAFRPQRLDGRAHHLFILAADGAVLAGMRIEPADHEPRAREAEAALLVARDDAAGLDQELTGQEPRHISNWDVDGGRHHGQLFRPQQHHRTQRRFAGEVREEFGVAGKLNPAS